MSSNRRKSVIILLQDYMNFLPPGPQEAFVPVGSGGSAEESWPLTPECEKRMNSKTFVGETYQLLNGVLNGLKGASPKHFNVIQEMYLHPGAGHRDIDHIKSKAGVSEEALEVAKLHDEAVDLITYMLKDVDLYVRWPQKSAGPKVGEDIAQRHDELYAIFKRYYEQLPYRQALTNAVFHMKDPHTEKPYYSRRHADRIVKARLADEDEAA